MMKQRQRHRSPLLTALLALMMLVETGVAVAGLTVMHGYVDYASALIWIQTDAPGPVEVAWRIEGDEQMRRATFDARALDDNIVVARLTGLLPGSEVSYAIAGDGERREGTLRAQPRWTRPVDAPGISIAIGSCFFLADANPIWGSQNYGSGYEIFDAIAAKKPDAMVWMGDNLYFQPQDELDPASMAWRYRRQRTFAPLRTLLTATSNVAIWDDHDYAHQYGRPIEFYQQLQKLNLEDAWSRVAVPTLVIHGEYDWIMTRYDHELIAAMVKKNSPGAAQFMEVPQMGHSFQHFTSWPDAFAFRESQFDPSVIQLLVKWFEQHR